MVEKVIARRLVVHKGELPDPSMKPEYQFLVKVLTDRLTPVRDPLTCMQYKDQSYIHAEWVDPQVFNDDRFGKRKLEKFYKQFRTEDDIPDDEDTIIDFCEVC